MIVIVIQDERCRLGSDVERENLAMSTRDPAPLGLETFVCKKPKNDSARTSGSKDLDRNTSSSGRQ